ncbi:MAG: DUF3553 domain-containing protein [Phycisphaerales bacterium]|nr:DUF3553 domain-containing protein [Phycisphaerales bacterium]
MESIEFGDQVRHPDRPEWGVGSVAKVDVTPVEGKPTQRVTVRFPNAGIKVLNAAAAGLERVEAEVVEDQFSVSPDSIDAIDRMRDDELLAPVASRKLTEIMLAIPEPCRDPFSSLEDRIRATLELYRFDDGGKGLIGWAVMQTGLNDPLSRFNRHELEEHFRRWSHEREQHLRKLLSEARDGSVDVGAIAADAPGNAGMLVQRLAR